MVFNLLGVAVDLLNLITDLYLKKQTPPQKTCQLPWLVWLSWLVCGPITERLWVQFLVRAHTEVHRSVPSGGTAACDPGSGRVREATNQCFSFKSILLSLPSCLSKNDAKQCPWERILKKKHKKRKKTLPIISHPSLNSGFRIPTIKGKHQNQMKPEEAEILRSMRKWD